MARRAVARQRTALRGKLRRNVCYAQFPSLRSLAAAALIAAGGAAAQAADATKVALVPGGPHPYFAAWEKAGQDAKKDFKLGAADYRVPQKWELGLQNSLLESLLSQGYNAFLVFPGDPVGSNSTVQELTENGAPGHRHRRLPERADDGAVLLRHRHRQFRLSRHQGADQGDGRQGPHRAFHRLPRRSQHAVAH